MTLSRDQLLTLPKLPCREIEVPELGGSVFVARLSGRERDRLEYAIQENQQRKGDIRAVVAVHCLCDADRALLLTAKDLEAVSALDGIALDRVYTAALRYNRMRRSDVEELEKNSEAAATGSTPSE